jgi:hypothetical protein
MDRRKKFESESKSKVMMDEKKVAEKRKIDTMGAEIKELGLTLREKRLEASKEKPIV